MKIKEIKASSILSKSKLRDIDYVINPYVGCSHSCVYCYAQYMKRYTNHPERWGNFVDIRINAVNLIPSLIGQFSNKRIFMSSVTDPYQPIEKKYELTRKILQKLIYLQPKLRILTKSDLIVRDIDLLTQFQNCEVGLTITTADEKLRKKLEPGAPTFNQRLNALKKLKENNLKTYLCISPIMPYLTDWKEIIIQTKPFVGMYIFDSLNVRGMIWSSIKTKLLNFDQDLLMKYIKIYFANDDYWIKVKKEIKGFCNENKIKYEFI